MISGNRAKANLESRETINQVSSLNECKQSRQKGYVPVSEKNRLGKHICKHFFTEGANDS